MTSRELVRGIARLIGCTVAAGLLASCGVLPSGAPASGGPAKVPVVGFLALGLPPASMEAYPFAVGELGYVDGQNIRVEYRFARNEADQLDQLASALVALKVDVLVTAGDAPALAARLATSTIPVVFAVAVDPVGSGLVGSIAHPGGNITGLSSGAEQAITKTLEFAGQLVPGLSEVGVLWSPDFGAMVTQLRALEAAAPTVGFACKPSRSDAWRTSRAPSRPPRMPTFRRWSSPAQT